MHVFCSVFIVLHAFFHRRWSGWLYACKKFVKLLISKECCEENCSWNWSKFSCRMELRSLDIYFSEIDLV